MELVDRLRSALTGRYQVERELGRGGMAVVYLARDARHDRQVAIKVLRPEFAATLTADRFVREIRIASGLDHPLIIPVHDSGVEAGLVWYAMPYVEGESLRDRLRREKQLPLDEALAITREVAEALDHAHQRGIVHRDIKPANILLRGGHAVVSDFGIARALSEAGGEALTQTGVIIGTPGYMSPEQATGEKDIDRRSDVYSLACVLYEMLTGETPYTGPSAQAIIAKQLTLPAPSATTVRETVPPEVDQALHRALAKVPADRFEGVSDFAAAVRRPARSAGRPVGLYLAIAGAVVAVLVVGVSTRWGGGAGETSSLATLAVLYFADHSPDGGLRHVAAGLTEEVIDELSAVGPLRVVSAAGVRPFRGRSVQADSLARVLGVGSVVDGSLDSAGGMLRISVRLIDAATLEQRGTETFQWAFTELPSLGRRVSEEVASFLRRRLGEEIQLRQRRTATRNADAWALVQRAQELRRDADRMGRAGGVRAALPLLWQADSLLAAAEERDRAWLEPVLLRGWLAADFAVLASRLKFAAPDPGGVAVTMTREPADWFRWGLEHAERAAARAPGDPVVRELRGALLFRLGSEDQPDPQARSFQRAEAELRSAVAEAPGLARAWFYLSLVLQNRGEMLEAAFAAEKALAADAYLSEAPAIVQTLMFAALERASFDTADVWCKEGLRRFPGDRRFRQCELTLLGWSSARPADAARAWELMTMIERSDTAGVFAGTGAFRRYMIAAILARAGLRDSARRMIAQASAVAAERPNTQDAALYEAYVRELLGQSDQALALLEDYLRSSPQSRSYVARSRWFRSLQGDPRFQRIVAQPPEP
ncbi:MAG TPA: protein kinase [Gemmatimonadales bacterium]|nr:protein kinase [Gemmatimonadales bacterium]